MTDTLPPDTRYLKRRDTSAEHGWQFQFELEPIKESKWFSDKKYGSTEAAFQAARDYRTEFFQTASELGMISGESSVAGGDTPIYLSLNPSLSLGTATPTGINKLERHRGVYGTTFV